MSNIGINTALPHNHLKPHEPSQYNKYHEIVFTIGRRLTVLLPTRMLNAKFENDIYSTDKSNEGNKAFTGTGSKLTQLGFFNDFTLYHTYYFFG